MFFSYFYKKKYDAVEVRKKELEAEMQIVEELHKKGLINEKLYIEAILKLREEMRSLDFSGLMSASDEYSSFMAMTMKQTLDILDSIKTKGKLELDDIIDIAQAAAQTLTFIFAQYSAYANAERDIELAKIEDRYDKEIEAAGNNTKKREKLETEKEKEIAKIKNKYNKKAMGMEIAQAIAQTAANALAAYGAALKIGGIAGLIMAPIAAAMATAAGMIQVMTIKKQHQAEAAGYYAGGFTKRSPDNREEAGVVHANEFVANHQAVANPAVSPVLHLLDRAQRSNTVARLTREDVSNALGQGAGVSARGVLSAPVPAAAAPAGGESTERMTAVIERTASTLDRLNDHITEGIESYVIMDGEQGLDNQYRRFQKLKNSPKR